MARMSIDDKFLRDPRVLRFATDLAMNKFEIHGRLLAVFAVTYDLERDVLTPDQIDTAAEFPGFADAMFAADLAVTSRRGLRIRGARERIKYLGAKVEAGRIGGIKSGESRRKTAKQKRASNEARPNPPDPVPDLPPDPVPDQRSESPPARAIPPSPVPSTTPAPIVPSKSPQAIIRGDIARTHEPTLDQLWSELEAERQRVAAKLGMTLLPLVAHDQGRDELARALAEATKQGRRAELAAQVRNAIAVAAAEAEADPDELQWLSGAIFRPNNFRRLAAAPAPKAKRRPAQAAAPISSAPVAPADDRSAWLREDTSNIAPQLLGIAKETA